jgi:hypothetical protein
MKVTIPEKGTMAVSTWLTTYDSGKFSSEICAAVLLEVGKDGIKLLCQAILKKAVPLTMYEFTHLLTIKLSHSQAINLMLQLEEPEFVDYLIRDALDSKSGRALLGLFKKMIAIRRYKILIYIGHYCYVKASGSIDKYLKYMLPLLKEYKYGAPAPNILQCFIGAPKYVRSKVKRYMVRNKLEDALKRWNELEYQIYGG